MTDHYMNHWHVVTLCTSFLCSVDFVLRCEDSRKYQLHHTHSSTSSWNTSKCTKYTMKEVVRMTSCLNLSIVKGFHTRPHGQERKEWSDVPDPTGYVRKHSFHQNFLAFFFTKIQPQTLIIVSRISLIINRHDVQVNKVFLVYEGRVSGWRSLMILFCRAFIEKLLTLSFILLVKQGG